MGCLQNRGSAAKKLVEKAKQSETAQRGSQRYLSLFADNQLKTLHRCILTQ